MRAAILGAVLLVAAGRAPAEEVPGDWQGFALGMSQAEFNARAEGLEFGIVRCSKEWNFPVVELKKARVLDFYPGPAVQVEGCMADRLAGYCGVRGIFIDDKMVALQACIEGDFLSGTEVTARARAKYGPAPKTVRVTWPKDPNSEFSRTRVFSAKVWESVDVVVVLEVASDRSILRIQDRRELTGMIEGQAQAEADDSTRRARERKAKANSTNF